MNPRALGLFATSAVASAGYACVSRLVFRRRRRSGSTTEVGRADAGAREAVQRSTSDRAKRLAEATGHVGKWYTHVPLSLAGGLVLALRGRHAAAAAIAGSSLLAAGASRVLDRVHDQRTPPPGKGDPDAQSYPSGHALETTAASLTSSWVLARERVAPTAATAPIAVVLSLVSGLGRLVLDRHWSTDSLAGYLAGIALGSACAGTYELVVGDR